MKKLKRIRSKLGFTLVELVVTVTILSIVSGMGIGIIASAIRNYSTASTTSVEQDSALAIENFIVESIRHGKKIVNWNDPSTFSTTESARYLYFSDDKLVTSTVTVDKTGGIETNIMRSYDGVTSVSVTVKKSKPAKEKEMDKRCFILVSYKIEMDKGYTVVGSTVMINAKETYAMDQANSEEFINTNNTLWISCDPAVTSVQDSTAPGHTKCNAISITTV